MLQLGLRCGERPRALVTTTPRGGCAGLAGILAGRRTVVIAIGFSIFGAWVIRMWLASQMYSTGTVHSREVLEQLRELYGNKVFDEVIYSSIRFAEASVAHKAIVQYASSHKGARAYIKLAETLLNGSA